MQKNTSDERTPPSVADVVDSVLYGDDYVTAFHFSVTSISCSSCAFSLLLPLSMHPNSPRKAYDRVTHQYVAIKKRNSPFSPVDAARRTNREFVLTQLLNHRNVISLLNAFTPNKKMEDFADVYFVTEHVQYPLKYLIMMKAYVFNAGENVSYLFYQLLCGIQHLHKANIIHRDLTTNNVVVSSNFVLKIIDLGLARQVSDEGKNLSNYICQRYYRAPEVILGLDYDKAVDIWSAACILADILLAKVDESVDPPKVTGTPLFQGNDQLNQWREIIKIVGTPDSSFLDQEKFNAIRRFIQTHPVYPPKSWAAIFPNEVFPPKTTDDEYPKCEADKGRDLLSKMLVIDPNRRITIDQALEHDFVMWKHDPGELGTDTNPYGKYNSAMDTMDLDEMGWKALFFGSLRRYELAYDVFGVNSMSGQQDCETCQKHKCECPVCRDFKLDWGCSQPK